MAKMARDMLKSMYDFILFAPVAGQRNERAQIISHLVSPSVVGFAINNLRAKRAGVKSSCAPTSTAKRRNGGQG